MRSFTENLADFQNSMRFSDSDILDLSELSESELDELKHQKESRKLLYKFCLNLEIDYNSVYDDKGFVQKSLVKQFESYPSEYRKIITCHLCKSLSKAVGGSSLLKEMLRGSLPNSSLVTSRFFSGNSIIEAAYIPSIQKAVSNILTEKEFNIMLSNIMFSKVPNYNFNIVRRYFNITYQVLADYLDISSSGVSNWGGKFCSPIRDDMISRLAETFGDYSFEEFTTHLITSKELRNRKCCLSLGSKLPDPPSDTNDQIGEIAFSTDEPKIDNKHIINNESLPDNNVSENYQLAITDEKVIKMYKGLTLENQNKVKSLITDLFFSQL